MNSPDFRIQAANALGGLIKSVLDEVAMHTSELAVNVFAVGGSWDVLEVCIDADPGDVKRIIGTKGAHINALRRYVRLWAETHDCSATVRDFSIPKDNRDRYDDFERRPDWPRDKLVAIIRAMAEAVMRCGVVIESADQGDVCHIIVRHDDAEDGRTVNSLSICLPILGNVMGKKNGHTLQVHVRPASRTGKRLAALAS